MRIPVDNLAGFTLGLAYRGLFLGPVRWGSKSAVDQKVRDKVDELAHRMGVHKPIQVAVNSRAAWQAHGTNYSLTPAGITIDVKKEVPSDSWKRGFYFVGGVRSHGGMTEDQMSFVLAHEIAHIKNNDLLSTWLIPVITFLATSIIFGAIVPLAVAEFMTFIAGAVSFIATSRFNEHSADMEACKYLSNKEKRTGSL